MKTIEIYFKPSGNTIVGNYTAYRRLDDAITRKSLFVPHGHFVKADTMADFNRLIEYCSLFGHCIKTLAAFENACNLSGVEFGKDAI